MDPISRTDPIAAVLPVVHLRKDWRLQDDEVKLAAALMTRVRFDPRAPQAIFEAWEWAFYNLAIELAILRKGGRGEEIFLLKRSSDDKFYAGEWHMPGQVVLPGSNFARTMAELLKRELGETLATAAGCSPKLVHMFEFSKKERPRGQGFCFLHRLEVSHELSSALLRQTRGVFYPIDRLPDPMVGHHITMIDWLIANPLAQLSIQ